MAYWTHRLSLVQSQCALWYEGLRYRRVALGPCKRTRPPRAMPAQGRRRAPAGSSRKSGRLPQRHLQVLPLELTGGGRQAQANPPVENDARTNWRRETSSSQSASGRFAKRTNWRRETSSSQSASGRFAKQTGAHHGGRVTAHNSPSPGAVTYSGARRYHDCTAVILDRRQSILKTECMLSSPISARRVRAPSSGVTSTSRALGFAPTTR